MLSYKEKLNSIKAYTKLGINSSKYKAKNPNFTKTEKWLISYYYNKSEKAGYFDYKEKDGGFRVKFIKTKDPTNKIGKRFTGFFMQGAAPSDKVVNGKIIKANFEKIFIPMDFSDIGLFKFDDKNYDPNEVFIGEYQAEYNYVYDIVSVALDKFYDELIIGVYFTIVLNNGWELGQYNRKSIAEKDRKDGQPIAQDLSGDKKIENLSAKITEQLNYGINKYKLGTLALVTGVYIWKFKNQRKPNNKEKKAIKGRRKRRK